MLEQLKLLNLPTQEKVSEKLIKNCFILKTCQRTLVISTSSLPSKWSAKNELIMGKDAYILLLEIICGLQSKLIGENEIVAQFKTAYQSYNENPNKCTTLLLILEKLFKDAKEVRTKYLLGLGQKTYSSLTRKHILKHENVDSVLILGSGQLAEDLINQFKKKVNVFISARNQKKMESLAANHDVQTIGWKDFDKYTDFPFIANSIGCSKAKFINDEFFSPWVKKNNQRLFIDLGAPSVLDTGLTHEQGVLRLKEIFAEGAIHEKHKLEQIKKAQEALSDIASTRHKMLLMKWQKQQIYNAS